MRLRLLGALALSTALYGCPRTPADTGTHDTGTHDTGTTDTSTHDTSTHDTGTTDTATGTDCYTLPGDLPAFLGGIPDPPGITSTAYTNDAGLQAVVDAVNADTGGTTYNLAVSNVTVTQVGYTPAGKQLWNIWFADGHAAVTGYLSGATVGIPIDATPNPGDVVSFTVTAAQDYNGTIEITDLKDWTIDTAGGSAVYVNEATGQTLDFGTDGLYIQHVYGELTSDPTDCGGSTNPSNYQCFDYTSGSATGPVAQLRIKNSSLGTHPFKKGDCVEVYAPMSEFNSQTQFFIQNLDWQRWYGNAFGN